MLGSTTVCLLPITQTITYLYAELANHGRSHHIPFKAIADQTSVFINPEYLSTRFKFRDPRNMHKSAIEDFFNHVLQQQMAQGPERAFRFKAVKASDGSVSPTHYPDDLNNPPPSQQISKCSGQRNAEAIPDAESVTRTSPHANANQGKEKGNPRESNTADNQWQNRHPTPNPPIPLKSQIQLSQTMCKSMK